MGIQDELVDWIKKNRAKAVLIALGTLCAIGWKLGTWGDFTFPKPPMLFAVVAATYFLGRAMWDGWRYHTRQYVDQSGHGSIKAPGAYPCGKLAIIPTGSIDYDLMAWEGGESTRIVPRSSIDIYPTFMVSWSRPMHFEFNDLPSDVQRFIRSHASVCKPPYLYTECDLRPEDGGKTYKEIMDRLGKLKDDGGAVEELKKIVVGIKADFEVKAKEKEGGTSFDVRLAYYNSVVSELQTLLEQATQGLVNMADVIGTLKRVTEKKPFLDMLSKEKQEKVLS